MCKPQRRPPLDAKFVSLHTAAFNYCDVPNSLSITEQLYQDIRKVKLILDRRRVINNLMMKNNGNIIFYQRFLIRERALISLKVLRLGPFVLLVKAKHG